MHAAVERDTPISDCVNTREKLPYRTVQASDIVLLLLVLLLLLFSFLLSHLTLSVSHVVVSVNKS